MILNSVIVSVGVLLSSMAFAAEARPIESLQDLPTSWAGTAGGLFQATSAALTIDKILSVSREERTFARTISYDVIATFIMGERKLSVKKIKLVIYDREPKTYDLHFELSDELVTNLVAQIKYDELTNQFILRDYLERGVRRFVLRGSSPRML